MTSHSSLTLYAIEDALLGLIEAREDILSSEQTDETPAELAAIETALADYVRQEIRKCDGIHHFLNAAKAAEREARDEAERMEKRARRIKASMDRLKSICVEVMAMAGTKRIDGTAGRYLLRKGNGGLAPLVVQEDILSENFRDVTVRVPKQWWRELLASLPPEEMPGESTIVTLVDEPANARIRECLKYMEIPGAHQGERGESLIIK